MRSRQRSGWCCSTGLGNDCAVWKQDGQSVGLTRWLAKEVRFGWLLPSWHLITSEEGSLRVWKGIKQTARVRYDDKEAASKEPVAAIIL